MTIKEAARMIGERVVMLRKARGLNQTELAERSGLQRPTLSRVENGERLPSVLTLCSIAVGMEVTTDELTGQVCEQIRAELNAV